MTRGTRDDAGAPFLLGITDLDLFDVMVVVGLALLTAGLYFVYAPLALIAPGVFLIGVGLFGAGRRGGD